jgi:S1-C subfamily serine protease
VQVGNEKKEKIIEHHLNGNEDISILLDSLLGNNGIRFNSIEILRQQMDEMPRMLDSLLEGLSDLRGLNIDNFFRQLPATSSKPFLGIVFEDVVSDDDTTEKRGISITRIVPGSAAEEAGLQAGDVLIVADDQPVNDIPTIQKIVGSKNIGDKLTILYERDGHVGSTVATLKAKKEGSTSWGTPEFPEFIIPDLKRLPKCEKIILEKSGPRLGISVTNMTDEARRDLRVKKGGVLITKVDKGSSAANMGLSVNDVIIAVNGTKIHSPEQLKNVVANISLGTDVAIEYIRYGRKKKVSGTLNEYSRAWE